MLAEGQSSDVMEIIFLENPNINMVSQKILQFFYFLYSYVFLKDLFSPILRITKVRCFNIHIISIHFYQSL